VTDGGRAPAGPVARDGVKSPEGRAGPVRRKRRPGAAAATVAASLVLALAVAEVALRAAGFGYELRAVVVDATAPDPETFYEFFALDRRLAWVPKDYHGKLDEARGDRPDVVFTGDSCTHFGTYPEMLARGIAERTGREPRTLNLGVAGWSSHQGMRQVEKDLPPLRPKVITVYFGWNDHWLSIGIEDDAVARVNESPLFHFRKLKLGQLLIRAVVSFRSEDPRPRRVPEEKFRENLERIVAAAREMGAVPVLLTAPSCPPRGVIPPEVLGRWIEDESQREPLHRRYADIVREVAAERDALLCDLAARFDRFPPGVRNAYFLNDGVHLNETGNREIARLLFDCFRGAGLLRTLGE